MEKGEELPGQRAERSSSGAVTSSGRGTADETRTRTGPPSSLPVPALLSTAPQSSAQTQESCARLGLSQQLPQTMPCVAEGQGKGILPLPGRQEFCFFPAGQGQPLSQGCGAREALVVQPQPQPELPPFL